MTTIFTEFLRKISEGGLINPLRSLSYCTLNNHYPNTGYQDVLVKEFGNKAGSTTFTISHNQVLDLGSRSFYLKFAMLATQQECYAMLDYIYAAIVAKKPGHYWELLEAIKKINDHCNDTKVKDSDDDTPCNLLLFRGADETLVPANRLSPKQITLSIQNLIKQSVELIGATARIHIGPVLYLNQQTTLTRELDELKPDPSWRLKIPTLTIKQLQEARTEFISQLISYQQEMKEKAQEIKGSIEPCHDCGDTQCAALTLLNQQELLAMKEADAKRYTEELAARNPVSPSRMGLNLFAG